MTARTIPGDWHPGFIPENVDLRSGAYLETSYSFQFYRSRRPVGMVLGANSSAYIGCMFDLGTEACFQTGENTLLNGLWLICDQRVTIGDSCLLSWNVVIMDTYRVSPQPAARRTMLREFARTRSPEAFAGQATEPVHIGNNVWIGFDCCILPGTTIGDGAIIGARSVVGGQVPPNCIFAGNPAKFIRSIDSVHSPAEQQENHRG